MAYQIGTDEAGYGPNLGPLMICGSRWSVPDTGVELYDLLGEVVSDTAGDNDRICICDSKNLYKSSGSIEALEKSVLAILFGAFGMLPHNLKQMEQILDCQISFSPPELFEKCKEGVCLPLVAKEEQIESIGSAFRSCCERQGVALDKLNCKAIFPEQFNQLIESAGNKAHLLSTQSIEIVRQLLCDCGADAKLVCDRHGGRSRYLGLINHYLTDQFVTVVCEQQHLSQYCWKVDGQQIELNFQTGGESFLPTAVSSMVAKYVRELTMLVWNNFWAIEVPGIKPTKGYPVDARRFRKEIVAAQQALDIDDELIWRSR